MSAVATTTASLAPDPEVPQRDSLLDTDLVAEHLAARLGREGALAIDRCERVRAKYQVGRSLRVLHRIEVAGRTHWVAGRTFPPHRSERVYTRALADAVAAGPLRGVAYDPELATVFWTFPNDRKIRGLETLARPPAELARSLPRPWTRAELTAYAPEKSATARCVGADGSPLAFAKVYAAEQGERTAAVHQALASPGAGESTVRAARALAYSGRYRTLLVEPIEGRPVAELDGAELERGLAGMAATLAALHRRPVPPGAPRSGRLRPQGLTVAAALIGRARPDVASRARALASALAGSFREPAPLACLHGDAHPKNGILDGRGVVLIDLDQVCGGPAAADLGGLLATLAYSRCVDGLTEAGERRLADAVLGGYAAAGTPPPEHSLRWHLSAALLVERALRSVQRLRPRGLERLDAILEAAEASCP